MIGNQVMTGSVSVIDRFRRWDAGELTKWVGEEGAKEEAELTWEEFLVDLTLPQTPKMKAGIAFHEALERIDAGNFSRLETDDFLFDFSEFDGEMALATVAEIPTVKYYGDMAVRGRCDAIYGSAVADYKLAFSSFDAERYTESFQWRFYLDMLKADQFTYYVFEGYERRGELGVIDVKRMHTLKLYRYPEMEAECRALAQRFHEVALQHPEIAKIRDVEDL